MSSRCRSHDSRMKGQCVFHDVEVCQASMSSSRRLSKQSDTNSEFTLECKAAFLSIYDDIGDKIESKKRLSNVLQQSGRNPTRAALDKYWTRDTESLSFSDFVDICRKEPVTTADDLMKAFRKIDVNGDGYISLDELYKIMNAATYSEMTHRVSHPSARFVPGQYRGKKMVARRQSNTTGELNGMENFDNKPYAGETCVMYMRCLLVFGAIIAYLNMDHLQHIVDITYGYLLTTYIFNSVYFETWFVVFCYPIVMGVFPLLVSKFRCLDKYKIHPAVHFEVKKSFSDSLIKTISYISPLMLLDTFMIKKYTGVDPIIWTEKRNTFIQTTRALPVDPPAVTSILYQLVASLIVYDALFFVVHLTLHKNFYLYKYIHKFHHEHGMVNSHVASQLMMIERIALILSANFGLKVFNSHPLTRMIFFPILLGIVIDHHSGYDLPFGMHRIIPFGIVGGSVKHFEHHMSGRGNYQPIFTYLDTFLDWYGSRRRK